VAPSSHRRSPDELALALSGPLGQWRRAVELEHQRLEDEIDTDSRSADAALFVVAVRNVVRLAQAVAALRKDPRLDAAISLVDAAVPGARNVRVPLDRVDNYTGHRGRLWRSPRASTGYRIVFERTDGRSVVYVGELAFDVEVAANAARDLAEATLKAIDRMTGSEAQS
jgi:hypothetical protein